MPKNISSHRKDTPETFGTEYIVTPADQKRMMGSEYSGIGMVSNPEVGTAIKPLYDMIKDNSWKTYLGENFFPEFRIMDGKIFMPSHRIIRYDSVFLKYEWYITMTPNPKVKYDVGVQDGKLRALPYKDKSTLSEYVINPEYKTSYVELLPNMILAKFESPQLMNSTVSIGGLWDLSSDKYIYISKNNKIKNTITDAASDKTATWASIQDKLLPITTVVSDGDLYVPMSIPFNSDDRPLEIDSLFMRIKSASSEAKFILPTSNF